jgi:FMN-dependent oxidoreductase (nitrilotriacetate monooxygenase family)
MSKPRKQIKLSHFHMCTPSQSWAGFWTHPDDRGRNYTDIQYYVDMAQIAERGLFDTVFFADSIGFMDKYGGDVRESVRAGAMCPMNDPTLAIPTMAYATKNIGFGATVNLSYEHPYMLARRMSTLDHLTKGRVGWNIVAGYVNSGARAMGQDGLRSHDERYNAAEEFMEVVYKYWEHCWDDDAMVRDPARRIYADPGKVRVIDHDGQFFRSYGVHMCEPSLQRTPVLFQAGTSTRGRAFAARHAECVFITGNTKEMVRNHIADLRARAVQFGRAPEDVAVIAGCTIVVAPTDAEARDRHEELRKHLDVGGSLAVFSALAGIDFSQFDPDDPIEYIRSNATQSFIERITVLAKGRKWRMRDLTAFHQDSPTASVFVVGSPSTVADQLLSWIDETGLDGFNVYRTAEPAGLKSVVDLLVPELQSRGAYKTRYAEGSLRHKLFGKGDRLGPTHPAKGGGQKQTIAAAE